MVNMNQVFNDFDEADPSATGARNDKITVHGKHIIEVEEIKFKDSEKYNAVYFIVNFKVLKTNSDKVTVGQAYSWTHNMIQKHYGAANTKQFMAAALGLEIESEEAKNIGREMVEEAWGDEQPLAGQIVRLQTSPKVTESGYEFCVHTWAPSSEDDSDWVGEDEG